ncbi:MAG TPA: hypothetical protein VJS37_11760, partial [Terriglobales bacterium]|nr:hypothetical protein [Terriglobales bacterium]
MAVDKHRQKVGRSQSRSATARAKKLPEVDKGDFIPYPTNKVVGIIDDVKNAKAAVRDLQKAGFSADQIRVLTGKEGARRINARGDKHGVWARMLRSFQKVFGDYEIP